MSEQNVELVRSIQPTGVDLVELFGEGNESLLSGLAASASGTGSSPVADDFEVRFIARDTGPAGPQAHGAEGLVEMWRDWLAPWSSYRLDVEDFIDAGDEVVVFARVHSRTARDGVAVEHAPAAVWTIEGGKVVRLRFFLDRDQALEAVGLSGRSG